LKKVVTQNLRKKRKSPRNGGLPDGISMKKGTDRKAVGKKRGGSQKLRTIGKSGVDLSGRKSQGGFPEEGKQDKKIIGIIFLDRRKSGNCEENTRELEKKEGEATTVKGDRTLVSLSPAPLTHSPKHWNGIQPWKDAGRGEGGGRKTQTSP